MTTGRTQAAISTNTPIYVPSLGARRQEPLNNTHPVNWQSCQAGHVDDLSSNQTMYVLKCAGSNCCMWNHTSQVKLFVQISFNGFCFLTQQRLIDDVLTHIMLEICPCRRSLLPEFPSWSSCVLWVYGTIPIIGRLAAAWENELNVLRYKHLLFVHKYFLESSVQLPVQKYAIVRESNCTHRLTAERGCGKKNASILRIPLCPQCQCLDAWHCWHGSWRWTKGFLWTTNTKSLH